MLKDGRWEKIFAPHYGKLLQDVAGEKKTMINYYLTLGIHGEWEQIRKRVDQCKEFDVDGGW